MKRITLFLSLFLAFTAFAKAASTDNAAISQFQNKLTTTVLAAQNVRTAQTTSESYLRYVTLTTTISLNCSNGTSVVTGYVYTLINEDTGAIVSTTYSNTGNTCPPANPPS